MAIPTKIQQERMWKQYIKNYMRLPDSFGPQKVMAGKMYQFKYVAKVAEYWDKYPVTLIIDVKGKHFLGLSIHYFPPKMREFFLKKVLLYNMRNFKQGKPAQISYAMIKDMNNQFYKEGILLIRKYLKSHIRSKMAEIPWTEWHNIATAAGNGQWMNISANEVWKRYNAKLRGLYTGQKEKVSTKGRKKRITRYKEIRGYNKPKRKL